MSSWNATIRARVAHSRLQRGSGSRERDGTDSYVGAWEIIIIKWWYTLKTTFCFSVWSIRLICYINKTSGCRICLSLFAIYNKRKELNTLTFQTLWCTSGTVNCTVYTVHVCTYVYVKTYVDVQAQKKLRNEI
jgi:hypothetical protein